MLRHGPPGHLRAAWARAGFARLLGTRLFGQAGDGIFQASVAGVVLFSPQSAASAADVAAGFAVVLLPYSLVGPFAGVLLDRWWRQRVLVVANLVRAAAVIAVAVEVAAGLAGVPFYASALVVVSLDRFVLAALPAALPHVVGPDELVTANSLSTTLGALVATVAGGLAIALRGAIGDSDAVIAALAAVPYLVAAGLAHGFGRTVLGPDDVTRDHRETVQDVLVGLREGARHVRSRRAAYAALLMIASQRFAYGVTTVAGLLLYRNYFHEQGLLRSGLGGLAQVVGAAGMGAALAAVVTPAAARRLGFVPWASLLLVLGAVLQGTLLTYDLAVYLAVGAGFGFAAQGIKISVDTIVQQTVADDYRGRVFSFYDTLFNMTFVAAATMTALLVPDTGRAPRVAAALTALYAVTAFLYLRRAERSVPPRPA